MLRISAAFLAIFALVGCSPKTEEDPDLKAPEPKVQKTSAKPWPTGVKIHRNEKDEVICPIMGGPIASLDKSVGYQDYQGVRYYFCCDMCPETFKANPKKYAETPSPDKKSSH